MPTYAYACTACGHAFEIVQSFSDDSLSVCPECEGRLRKVFSSVGVVFKGSGFYRNDARAPLLFISGSEDHLMPPAVQSSNAKHYKSNTITEIREFPGRSHLMPAEHGWEEIADLALVWAKEHARHQPQAALATS